MMLSAAIQSSPHIELFAKQSRVQAAQLRLVQANNRADIEWSAGASADYKVLMKLLWYSRR